MNGIHPQLLLLISWFSLLCMICGFASRDNLGVAPQDESYYKSNVIKCKDGSRKFTRQQLNDDFCDCPDGTDEPGTSACPEGKFYCRNVGHDPIIIFSSRVNDGICDCCDGSDEYNNNVKCSNTCWEAGRVAREKLKKRIAIFEEGVKLRKIDVEQAKQAYSADEAELSELRGEEKVLQKRVQNLKEQKERIEKALEERQKKEKEEQSLSDEKEKADKQEKSTDDPSHEDLAVADRAVEAEFYHDGENGISDTSDAEQVGAHDHILNIESHEADETTSPETSPRDETEDIEDPKEAVLEGNNQEEEASDNAQTLSREELGRLVASRWTGESTDEIANDIGASEKENDDRNIPDLQGEHDEDYTSGADDFQDEHHESDELDDPSDDEYDNLDDSTESYNIDEDNKDHLPDFTHSATSTWLEKIRHLKDKVVRGLSWFRKPVDISEGSHVQKEYDDANSKLTKIKSRISSLSEKLKHDFGREKEFYSFYGSCFEHKQNKYVYKVCPFKQATQVEGHGTTQLGRWEKFEDSYRVMHFSNGDRCWNGPDRSIKVRLRCGLKTELADVDEPSRCEYLAFLTSPALCLEEKLKELRQKLEQMKSGEPQSRDEL